MLDSPHVADLHVPYSHGRLSLTIVYLLIVFFYVVAACNLFYYRVIDNASVVASVLWIGLVTWIVVASIRQEDGIRQYLINRLGHYADQQLVRATSNGDATTISFGYLLFGRFRSYLSLDATAISSIDWSTGQASAIAGRELNDWHVAVWYHHPLGPRRKPYPGVRDEEVYIVGPSGPRATVERFGQDLIEFLTSVGVNFSAGRDECEFNTPARRSNATPSSEAEE